MLTIAGLFIYYYYKNLEIYEVGRLAILQKRDFATFGYKRKSKVEFFGNPAIFGDIVEAMI